MRYLSIALVITALLAAGCATDAGQKETAGTLLGAAAGGLIGSQIGGGTGTLVAVGVGTFAGALLGREIGRSLDQTDQLMMERNAQQSLEYDRTYESSEWSNPDSGHYGSMTPTRTYQTAEGRYCREYTQKVTVAGEEQEAYGVACRQPDGSWEIIK